MVNLLSLYHFLLPQVSEFHFKQLFSNIFQFTKILKNLILNIKDATGENYTEEDIRNINKLLKIATKYKDVMDPNF